MQSRGSKLVGCLLLPLLVVIGSHGLSARADTLPQTLARAYQFNPLLNAERARQRATDENVPQALSGYRPQVTASLSAGLLAVRNILPTGEVNSATLRPRVAGITVTQTLFNSFRTANTVRQAEAQVRAGRETLRNVEQTVFLDAVTAYMGVVADQALVDAQRANVTALRETLAATRKRFDAGDVTPTDVAQAEARMNRGLADLNAVEVQLAVDQATYKQIVGAPPGRLAPAEAVDRLLPQARGEAVRTGRREHPTIVAASFDVDAATAAIKIAEGSLGPTVTVQGNVQTSIENDTTLETSRTDQASIIGQATVPIYDGGMAASQIRQAKETLGQVRIQLDRARDLIETAIAAAWAAHEGARTAITAAEAELRAAVAALDGVRKEANAGQRTTLDVLNAQQDLMGARSRVILAQRDRVVASYTVLSAMGRLDYRRLGLATPDYEPQTHYHQVRDAWHGVRTPDGR